MPEVYDHKFAQYVIADRLRDAEKARRHPKASKPNRLSVIVKSVLYMIAGL